MPVRIGAHGRAEGGGADRRGPRSRGARRAEAPEQQQTISGERVLGGTRRSASGASSSAKRGRREDAAGLRGTFFLCPVPRRPSRRLWPTTSTTRKVRAPGCQGHGERTQGQYRRALGRKTPRPRGTSNHSISAGRSLSDASEHRVHGAAAAKRVVHDADDATSSRRSFRLIEIGSRSRSSSRMPRGLIPTPDLMNATLSSFRSVASPSPYSFTSLARRGCPARYDRISRFQRNLPTAPPLSSAVLRTPSRTRMLLTPGLTKYAMFSTNPRMG